MQDSPSSSNSISSNVGSVDKMEAVGARTHVNDGAPGAQRLLVDFPGFSLQVTRCINFRSTFADDDESGLYKHLCDFLHWRDAVALGSTNKTLRRMYLKHSHVILAQLLEILDRLMGSKKRRTCGQHCCCEEIDGEDALDKLDPRSENDYDLWDGHRQCAAMVDFFAMVVKNLRRHLRMDRDDISDPNKIPAIIMREMGEWPTESDDPRWTFFVRFCPCRLAMALNLSLICLVIDDLYFGSHFICAEAACGTGELGGGAGILEQGIQSRLMAMLPMDDESIFTFMFQRLYPHPRYLQLFGEKLSRKIFLAAPIMDWVHVRCEGLLARPNLEGTYCICMPHMEKMEELPRFVQRLAQRMGVDFDTNDSGDD